MQKPFVKWVGVGVVSALLGVAGYLLKGTATEHLIGSVAGAVAGLLAGWLNLPRPGDIPTSALNDGGDVGALQDQQLAALGDAVARERKFRAAVGGGK